MQLKCNRGVELPSLGIFAFPHHSEMVVGKKTSRSAVYNKTQQPGRVQSHLNQLSYSKQEESKAKRSYQRREIIKENHFYLHW